MHDKPQPSTAPRPKHLDLKKDRGLTVTWLDGRVSFYPIAYLRKMSPSAEARELRDQLAKNPLTVLPDTPSDQPSLSSQPSDTPSDAPSDVPSSQPSISGVCGQFAANGDPECNALNPITAPNPLIRYPPDATGGGFVADTGISGVCVSGTPSCTDDANDGESCEFICLTVCKCDGLTDQEFEAGLEGVCNPNWCSSGGGGCQNKGCDDYAGGDKCAGCDCADACAAAIQFPLDQM